MFDWLQQLEFEHPARLYALLVVPFVLYFGVASVTGLSLWRRVASSLCRGALLALLIFAWSGVAHRGPTSERFTVFFTDRSASVESSMQEADQLIQRAIRGLQAQTVRNVNFGAEPENRNADSRADRLHLDPMGSNPGAAVLLAAASCPPDRVPQIVLQTDGQQTAGDLFAAAQGASSPIIARTLTAFANPEVCVADINLVATGRDDGEREVEVLVMSNIVTSGRLIYSGFEIGRPEELGPRKFPPHEVTIDVVEGENRVRIQIPDRADGNELLKVQLADFKDTIVENNTRTAIIAAPRVLEVLDETALPDLYRLLGRRCASIKIDGWDDLVADDLAEFDLIVLQGDFHARLGINGFKVLEQYVRSGGGLLVMGDDSTFGLEAYRDTALEQLLPVRATEEVAVSRPTLAMLLVIDKSKSMEDDNRLALAKEAAKRTVDLDLLTPQDKVGVLAFGNTSEWISPIVPCDNKAKLKQQIDGLTAQGQTNMFPALQRAYLALTEAHADRRHVILMTDGVPSPGDFDEIAAKMAEAGITVSTVSIGAGADQLILKDISRIASGRHIHCEAAEELTEKLVQETRSVAKSERQQHEISVYRRLPDLDVASAPPLAGYVLTSPKPEAELLLLAGPGDPLLAWWRYGAGAAAAFTSTVGGEWGQGWERWNGNAKFWSRVADLVARKPLPPDFSVEIERRGAYCRVTIDIVNADAAFLNDANVDLMMSRIDVDDTGLLKKISEHRMIQVVSGRYEVQIKLPDLGAYIFDMRWEDPTQTRFDPDAHAPFRVDNRWEDFAGQWRHVRRAVTWNYPDELQLGPADENLLRNVAAVSGGVYDPTPKQISAPARRTVERVTPLWRFLILAGLIVFVVEVGLRRP